MFTECRAAHGSISTASRFTSYSGFTTVVLAFFDDEDRFAYLNWLDDASVREESALYA